jgi:hypothetical protein
VTQSSILFEEGRVLTAFENEDEAYEYIKGKPFARVQEVEMHIETPDYPDYF